MDSHLDRTANNFRQKSISEAEVIAITDASDSVKLLTLRVAEKDFSFKAGQWVDFVVPGVERVGGFSMYTSPVKLREEGIMGLAVKESEQQPAHWVHTQCTVGSKVSVRVGGDQLVYDPQSNSPSWNLLLIAGGIGINPLFSVLNHVCDYYKGKDSINYKPGSVELLYSASEPKELIFKESISEMVKTYPGQLASRYFVTRAVGGCDTKDLSDVVIERRISQSDIQESLQRLKKLKNDSILCLVCGPPPMIDSMEQILQQQGIPKGSIMAEKWW